MRLLTYPLAALQQEGNAIEAKIANAPHGLRARGLVGAVPAIAKFSHMPHGVRASGQAVDNVVSARFANAPHGLRASGSAIVPMSTRFSNAPHGVRATGATASAELYSLPTTTGLELWLNAQHGVIGDPTVATWEDQHTSGRDLSGFSNTLTISGNTYNGLTALNFAAGNITPAIAAPFSTSNVWTVFLVCTTTSDSIWALGGHQIRLDTGGLGDIRWVAGSTAQVVSPAEPLIDLNIYTFVYDGNIPNVRIYQNGVEEYNGTIGNVTAGWSRLPARAFGDITDWIFYASTPSDADLNALGTTLALRYGRTWTTI